MDPARLRESIQRQWRYGILECLQAYVRIPCKSPAFDPGWEDNGHIQTAMRLIANWCSAQELPGSQVRIEQLPGLTPVLLIDVPGELPGCTLIYGHLDKQPEFPGWSPGLGPWEPVQRDGRLYGRGAADDGYAVFSAVAALVALKEQRIPLVRCVILIDASEESGSIHLEPYLRALGPSFDEPSLVVCLDSECGNYEQLWCTNSVRGCVDGRLLVRVLAEGVHSGLGGGIAASPVRIVQQLLARLEDPVTGEVLPPALRAEVPKEHHVQLQAAAIVLGGGVAAKLPFLPGVSPECTDPSELLINNTWRTSMAVIGADGIPDSTTAGNVLLPHCAVRLSLRLAPTCDAAHAADCIRSTLERDPPYQAAIRFEPRTVIGGWAAPPMHVWLRDSLERASRRVFGRSVVHVGCGGTLPLFSMLGAQFAAAQFFVTGVLGPHSNSHGPNEFLHLSYACQITECVALAFADHGAHLMDNGR